MSASMTGICVLLAAGAIVAAILGACGDATGAVETPTTAPTAATLATPNATDKPDRTDPLAMLDAVLRASNTNDVDAIRPLLTPEFQRFDDEVLRRTVLGVYRLPEGEEWGVDRYEEWVTVRSARHPSIAVVFRRLSGGELALAPGPNVLRHAAIMEQQPNPTGDSWGMTESGIERRYEMERGGEGTSIARVFTGGLLAVMRDGTDVTVTIDLQFLRGADGALQRSGHTWSTGRETGVTEVGWTNAIQHADRLEFPSGTNKNPANYIVSFVLRDVPAGERIKLRVEGMTVNDPAGGQPRFAIVYSMPDAPYPPDPATPNATPTTVP
jgi:hypothetical protein